MDNAKLKDEFSGAYKYGFHETDESVFKSPKGINADIVTNISRMKKEPAWMLERRLEGLKLFKEKPLPTWGADLSAIDFDNLHYYSKPSEKQFDSWDDVPEKMKNTFNRLGIPEAEQKFLAGVGAQYDCLTADTLVPTSSGLKSIAEIRPGDSVFALNEPSRQLTPKHVIAVVDKGIREVFEVTAGGRAIKATYNHPFLVLSHYSKPGSRRGRYVREWKYLNEIHPGDLVGIAKQLPDYGFPHKLNAPVLNTVVSITNQFGAVWTHNYAYKYNAVNLPKQTDSDLMWLFGLFTGDGWIDSAGKRVSFAIPSTEPELRSELAAVIDKLFGIGVRFENEYKLTIHSKAVAGFFAENGFFGKAKSKKLPDWVYGLPREQILAFLGGYLDSDGTVLSGKKSHSAVLTSANPVLLASARILTMHASLQASKVFKVVQKQSFGKPGVQIFYRFTISGSLKDLGSRNPFRFNRFGKTKYVHSFNSARNTTFRKHVSPDLGFAKIDSIEHVGRERVFDITVDSEHNFVAEGFIVHNSEVVYHHLKESLEKQGVVFLDMDSGLREHEEIVKKYFGTVIPTGDNKFAALNTAVWSGGSFVHIPAGVKVEIPLQAYFRINAKNVGQFERTLIVAEPGSFVHYVEGCSAPIYSTDALHSAVVEILALPGSHVRYTTIQNWSSDVYNLVTKRAKAFRDSSVEWIDGNIGSKVTQKYPCIMLMEPGARGEVVSIAFAGKGQRQDAGAKIFHLASDTSSNIISKSVSKDGGRTVYRGLVNVAPNASRVKSNVECDALILDEKSASDTIPYMSISNEDVSISHEASVSKLDDEKLFYLRTRGFTEEAAKQLLVQGFIEPFTRQLPMEYAVELNRLIELEMEGSVG